MIAINIIIDSPMQINMQRGWETPAQADRRRIWKCEAMLSLAHRLPVANDLINVRAYRHIAGLEQGGFFYEDHA